MKAPFPILLIVSLVGGCAKTEIHKIDLSAYPKVEIRTASGAIINIDSSKPAGGDLVSFKTSEEKTTFEFQTEQYKLAAWDFSNTRDDGIVVQVHGVGPSLPSGRLLLRLKDGKVVDTTTEHLVWSVDLRHGPLTLEEPNKSSTAQRP